MDTGAGPAQRSAMEIPRELGGYEIVEPLGRGGMGVVYRAREPGTGRGVAIKTVLWAGEGALAALRREILALSAIRHPGVVQILAEGIAGERPWYAMELIEGPSLRALLSENWQPTVSLHPTLVADDATTGRVRGPRGPVTVNLRTSPPPLAEGSVETQVYREPASLDFVPLLEHFARLCDPLGHVHAAGIVHRDLTPDNVIIRPTGEPVLVDFGLAAAFRRGGREALSIGGAIVGTTHYMAPEQIRGEVVDARADLYSLGCMLYEALTGRPPFVSATPHGVLSHHLYDPPIPPASRDPAIPLWLDALVMALLAKDPRDRIGYAGDVAAILRREQGMMAPRAARHDAAAPAYVYRPRMIGRADHVARFDPMIGALHDGRGGIAVLGGPSGVGKTRLAVELATRASAEGLRVIASECTALGADHGGRAQTRAAPLAPLRPLLQAVVDRCIEFGPEATERLLGDRAAVLATYEPALGRVPGAIVGAPPPTLSVEGTRARLYAHLRDTLRALADEAPLVLLVDDVQWADELTLRFLASLGPDFFASTGVLVLATHRSEEPSALVDELRARPDALVLEVGELGADDVRAMIGDMLALREVPRPLYEALAEQAAGVPFHVGEYLRAAVEDGVLSRRPGGAWSLANDVPLPSSLAELLRHRLERLGPLGRTVAQLAAVLGREFDPALLSELLGAGDGELDDALRDLVRRHIFEEATRGRLRFGHDKIREAAYDDLAAADRRRAHRDAARALEQRAGSQSHDLYPVLAHHWSMADEPARALEFVEKAGARALQIGAYQDTVDFLRRALAMTARGVPVDPARRGRWQRWLGEAAWGLGDVDGCGEHFAAALAALDRPVPTTLAGWLRASAADIGDQVRRRRARATPAAGDLDAGEAALAASRLSYRHYHAGENLPMVALVLRAVALADRAGTAAPVAHAYQQLGYLAGLFRFPRIAAHYFAAARGRATDTHDETNLAVTRYSEAMYLLGEGHSGEALRHAEAAVALLRDIGHAHELEVALSIQAHIEHNLGRYREALAHCQELYESSRERCNKMHESWGAYTTARELIALGIFDDAVDLCDHADALARDAGDQASLVLLGGLRALAEVRRGDLAAAGEHLDHWLTLVDGTMPTVWSLGHGYAAAAEAAADLAVRPGADDRDWQRARDTSAQLWRHAAVFPVGRPAALVIEARLVAHRGHRTLATWLARAAVARARACALPYEELAGLTVLSACGGAGPSDATPALAERIATRLRA